METSNPQLKGAGIGASILTVTWILYAIIFAGRAAGSAWSGYEIFFLAPFFTLAGALIGGIVGVMADQSEAKATVFKAIGIGALSSTVALIIFGICAVEPAGSQGWSWQAIIFFAPFVMVAGAAIGAIFGGMIAPVNSKSTP